MDLSAPFPTAHTRDPATPVLRTVLLCDIVDSTAMVERLGDQRAAALLRRHDTMLRQLVAFCHGQLIDKADGVLAVFERPIQALDFALRYQRGLHDIGREDGLTLKARIGLHVGDVMMWANEPNEVLAGAKAFEVEGLAKPVAARLMGLALPGQILMSGMAQNLCQRAVGELGESGAKLRWLMHGRYRFKGVPAPMLIHEAGEPGLSPLRAPPAIAFAERDWVVVADLQNRTDEALFDDALDTALLVGLEQSRSANAIAGAATMLRAQHQQFDGHHRRPPPQRQFAPRLVSRFGRAQRRQPRHPDLMHQHRRRHALEPVAAVHQPAQLRPGVTQFAGGALGQVLRHARHQDLARQGESHQACRHRLREALELERLRAGQHVAGRVRPHHHVADVHADARLQRQSVLAADVEQAALVAQREIERLDRSLEDRQHAVGLVDQLAVAQRHQLPQHHVVALQQRRRALVAEPFDHRGGVDDVAQQHRAQHRRRRSMRLRGRERLGQIHHSCRRVCRG